MHIGKYKIFNLLDEGLLFAFLASFGLPRRGGILQEVAQNSSSNLLGGGFASSSRASPLLGVGAGAFAPGSAVLLDSQEHSTSRHRPAAACREIAVTEGPGGLQSMGSQRVGHDWATKQQHAFLIHDKK